MADREAWPQPPIPGIPQVSENAFTKSAYEAEIALASDAEKRRRDVAGGQDDRVWRAFQKDDDAESALLKNFHESVRTLASANASRTGATAELVQKAAAALVGVYTTLLGLLYAVGEVGIPLRALLPAFFLGAAVVLSTAYAAFIRKTDDQELQTAKGTPRAKAITQTANFVRWSRRQYLARASFVRGAVASLAFGLIFLPVPLVSSQGAMAGVTVATSPTWPPATAATDAELVLYQAQVDEIATLRATKTSSPTPNLDWRIEAAIWVLAALGAAVVMAVVWLPAWRDDLS